MDEYKRIWRSSDSIGRSSVSDNSADNTNLTAPSAPAGWKYVRNAANTGWTAVEDK